MTISRRRFLHQAVAAGAVCAAARGARAEAYPARPLRWVVGFPPGGGADIVSRIMAPWLAERLGQPVVIENKPGASSNISIQAVVNSPPDGYTLLFIPASAAVNVSLFDNLQFNLLRDITPVSGLIDFPLVMVANPSLPAKTVPEFIAYAKANPGKISYGSSGVGTSTHLGVELFKSMTGIDIVHVPYKGGAQSSADLVAGQIQLVITNLPEQVAYMKSGRTRGLGVSTLKRSPQFPDIPSISETVPGYEVTVWYGLCAPAGMPRALLDKINADLVKAVTSPDTKERLASAGIEAAPTTPEEFSAFLKADVAKWAKVIKDANIAAE